MYSGRFIFSQVLDFLPLREFKKCVSRYHGEYKVRKFTCLDQFLCMSFAQLTGRSSLRDIEVCLRIRQKQLYHVGIRGKVSKSTLSYANETRDWRIFADFAQLLIDNARTLYAEEKLGYELVQSAYALDSTTIDLCLSLFPWAHFRKKKGAIKVHTLLDLQGNIPTFVRITDGKVHDVNILDEISFEPGSYYIMDRAYVDFSRLNEIDNNQSYFVTRAKSNLDYKRRYSHEINKDTGLKSDQTIVLSGYYTYKKYEKPLRRIRYFDKDKNKSYIYLTNNFNLDALSIADIYKSRWNVELFFKWIKQNLKIKKFYGLSENAVKTQIWISISIYVLVAIVKKKLALEQSLYTILQVLSLSLFEKDNLYQAIDRLTSQDLTSGKEKWLSFNEL
jgi:transposase